MTSLTIKFETEQYRRDDPKFDNWFIPLCRKHNVEIRLERNNWFLRGEQSDLIKMFSEMNDCLHKTFDDIIDDSSKKLKT